MKMTVVTLCFFCFLCVLCSTSASAQTAPVLSNNPQPTVVPDHPMHASQHAMAQYENLRGNDTYAYAQGEQPVSDYASEKYETPLGDIARAYRKEHAVDRKAIISVEK